MNFEDFFSAATDDSNVLKRMAKASEPTTNDKKSYQDDRVWKPTIDKVGNGYAVIRFLPAFGDREKTPLPWVEYWDHGFKGPTGQWYIERSLTSIGKPDPVGELNSKLWNSGREEDKETARKQKRRLHYVANILVVKDPGNPENEGKVFLYQFGKKIKEKIDDLANPEFPGEEKVNVTNPKSGRNFLLKIRNVEGYRNYDKSEFESKDTSIVDDLPEIFEQMHDLYEFIDPACYKSYDELQSRLSSVLGEMTMTQKVSLEKVEEPKMSKSQPSPFFESETDSEEDDITSYFAKLAEED